MQKGRSKGDNARQIRLIIISVFTIMVCTAILFFVNTRASDTNNDDNETPAINNFADSQTDDENSDEQKTIDETSNSNADTDQESANLTSIPPQSPQYSSSTAYSGLYPNLYCSRPSTQIIPNKTVFLTFDDGPSARTAEILDILQQKNVKATFFVVGNASAQGKALMKRIVDEGHTIGIHTYTHEFKQVYSSVEAYLDDFNKIYNLIFETTGVKPEIFRFPGGSKNSFNKNNYREIIAEMTRRGFDYFDWNLSAGDAVSRTPTPTQKCISNVLNSSNNYDTSVVLMHDANAKHTTVEALPAIIDGLREQGFTLDKLSHKISPDSYSLIRPYR